MGEVGPVTTEHLWGEPQIVDGTFKLFALG